MFLLFFRYLTVILMFLIVFSFYLSYPNVRNCNSNPNLLSSSLHSSSLRVCACGLPFPFALQPCLPFHTVLDVFQPSHIDDRLVMHCVLRFEVYGLHEVIPTHTRG